jgi:hypothetical protein
VTFTWQLDTDGTGGSGRMSLGDGIWAGSFEVNYAASHQRGGTVTIVITATDPHGNRAQATITAVLDPCTPVNIIG